MPQNVLNQVKFLCQKIWEVEWSGILFYDIEGEFGSKDFKITLQHIFPMNKGTQTYTEFETDGDYIEFLMDNPQFLQSQRALIHSHNNMSVFFSDTDMSEIKDNSEFYNYYLSLIVNNKEDMCAKIAFRGKNKEEIKRNISFKGTNGVLQTKTISTEVEKDVIFLYNCQIIKPTEVLVDEEYSKRVVKVIEKAKKLEEESKIKSYKSLYPQQKSLFEEETIDYNKAYGKLYNVHSDVEEFTASLLSLDALNTDSVEDVLKSLKKKFGNKLSEKNETEIEIFVKTICENFNRMYHTYFDDTEELVLTDTLEQICDVLETFATGNWVADEIYAGLIVLHGELTNEETLA